MQPPENPFEPTTLQPRLPQQPSNRPRRIAWALSLLLATVFAYAYYRSNFAGGSQWISLVLYGPPVGFLLVSGLRTKSSAQAMQNWPLSLAKPVLMASLVSVAAFIAFATTCCFTNILIGGFQILPEGYSEEWILSPALRGSLVTFASTLLGCWIVVSTQGWRNSSLDRERQFLAASDNTISERNDIAR